MDDNLKAKEIAAEIDPAAGGLFKRQLERAVILGMEAERERCAKIAIDARSFIETCEAIAAAIRGDKP